MSQPLNAKGKPFSWSYTGLSDYEGCPKRYAHSKFWCDTPWVDTEAIIWGNRLHLCAEQFLKKIPITEPELIPHLQPWLDLIVNANTEAVWAEREIALTRDMKQTSWFGKDAWFRGKLDVIVSLKGSHTNMIYDWKGLALNTLLPTPTGWTTMEDVQEGDTVFGADGATCTVIGKSKIHDRPCFKVTFDDGATVVCDDQHLWGVHHGTAGVYKYKVLPITEIHAELGDQRKSKRHFRVAAASPLEGVEQNLPVDPYVLGCWLGDGKRTDGSISCSTRDEELFELIKARGYAIGPAHGRDKTIDKCPARTVYGLRTELRTAGLLGNKHIPEVYLRASIAQRTELLRGLFDTDGTWNSVRKQAVFTTVVPEFAAQVKELVTSLGQRPNSWVINGTGFGKPVVSTDISFTPLNINPFKLSRKASAVSSPKYTRSKYRNIQSVEEVASVPTQCIAVDSPDNLYLCGREMIPTHNTGKVRDNFDQLRIFAAALSIIRPGADIIIPKFIWTKTRMVTGLPDNDGKILREEIPGIWSGVLGRVARMEEAWENEDFPARPSGLCPWCPKYDSCPNARRR